MWSVGSLPSGREMVDNNCQSLSKVRPLEQGLHSAYERKNQEAVLDFPTVQ